MSNISFHSTPPRMRPISGPLSASRKPGAETLRRELRETMLNKLFCLPYDAWMREFLPPQDDDAQLDGKAFDGLFDAVPLGESEPKMYDPFVKAVNGAGILADFVLAKTCVKPDLNDKDGLKVDGGMYPKDCPAVTEERTDWASVEVFIECKPNNSYDPYDETTKTGFPFAEARRDALGQISTYASRVFEYQHLTHHFGVVLLGSWARLGRWDRSGVVFSSVFDYKKEPAKLARFFWRVAHATAEARGHDPTATRVVKGSDDYKILQEWATRARIYAENPSLAQEEYVEKRFIDSLTDERPWWRLVVSDAKHGEKAFLVGKPTFTQPGVVCRGTRGYIALSISDDGMPLVYLKDCWRVVHDRSELEGDILSYLNQKGVTNIPTALYHGDVAGQVTRSQAFWKPTQKARAMGTLQESPAEVMGDADKGANAVEGETTIGGVGKQIRKSGESATMSVARNDTEAPTDPKGRAENKQTQCPMKKHQHYRLVVREVGLPLQEFRSGKELVSIIIDAILAHEDAHEKANIMHRDISVGNILFIPPTKMNGKTSCQGLLADWELSKRREDEKKEPRHPDRTGTWQFLSVNVLSQPKAQVEIADELESFLHVMIYCAIRYLPHTCENVGDFMYNFFDDGVRKKDSEYTCGMLKHSVMTQAKLLTLDHERIIFLRKPRPPKVKVVSENTPISDGPPFESSAPSGDLLSNEPTPDPEPSEADHHPINDIITDLLHWFAARYRILWPPSGPKKQKSKPVKPTTSAAGPEVSNRWRRIIGDIPEEDLSDDDNSEAQLWPSQAEVEKLAKKVKSHRPMLVLLAKACEGKHVVWPLGSEDKLADQLDSEYSPHKAEKARDKRAAPDDAQDQPGSKRRRGVASQQA